LSGETNPPEALDLINVRTTGTSREWGYRFKVVPQYYGQNKLSAIANLNERQAEKWRVFVEKH
jgi:hypothetical protein